MRKYILIFVIFLFPICLFAQMTDSQIIGCVKSEHVKGTNQQAIGASLLQRGVSKEQLERTKGQVEQENKSRTATTIGDASSSTIRANQLDGVIVRHIEGDAFTDMLRRDIFGKNIFNRKNISFIPDVNIPMSADYKLGAGNEIVIDIWSTSQVTIRRIIFPEGTISIDYIAPISLRGMTIEAANNYIKQKLSILYSGVDDSDGTSHIKLTLGEIQTMQINVMSEVDFLGTSSLSLLSSIFHALFLTGGINDIGSLREVNLYRAGQNVGTIDIYDFLLNAKSFDDIRLFDRDLIIVPLDQSLVNIARRVKRPMHYQIKDNEIVGDIINSVGGFVGGAYSDKVNLAHKTSGYNKIFTLNAENMPFFNLADGDIITIGGGLGLYGNRVQIQGRVSRPRYYEIGKDLKAVNDLIVKAGGLRENTFLDRVILTKEKDDLTMETITLILKAGRLLSSVYTAKVDVSCGIIDSNSTANLVVIAETFSFSIEDGLVADGKDYFVLKPIDRLFIPESGNTIKINEAVLYLSRFLYEKGGTLNYYIEQAGRYVDLARKTDYTLFI